MRRLALIGIRESVTFRFTAIISFRAWNSRLDGGESMTLMECLDGRKKTVEAIRLKEEKLSEMDRGSMEWIVVRREIHELRHELYELTIWLYDRHYYWALSDVLSEAFMDGDLTVPPEIIARIETKRKELIEREKRRLELVEEN